MLILFRVMQGAGGGGLQPMAQAILADMFPPQKRGLAFALYGITAIMAPTIGPTLGGWITDNYQLALDLLHQFSRRSPSHMVGHSLGGRSALPSANCEGRRESSTILASRCLF